MSAQDNPDIQLKQQIKDQQEEIDRLHSRLRSVVDYAPIYIQMVDTELRITFVNRTGEIIEDDQIIGRKVGDFSAPEVAKRIRRRLRSVLKTGKPTTYEFESIGGNGRPAWYRASAGPIYSDDKITGAVVMTFDVTEDRFRTEALKEGKCMAESARIRDRALLNSIGEGLVAIDENGRIATVNPAGAAMLGFRQKELVGQWFPGMVKAVNDDGEKIDIFERPSVRAISSGRVISDTLNYVRKDGSPVPVAVTISPVVISGRPIGAVEVFRNLTAERELDRVKEEFVSLASHQLRTPATGVKAYLSMMMDGYGGKLNSRQTEFLNKAFEANERQLDIVNDMLNVARMDAGRIMPELVSADLVGLVRDVVEEQMATFRERQQKVTLVIEMACLNAVLDPKLIRMAVENIISNASKYTREKGEIDIRVRVEGGRGVIEVKDNGVGIAKADTAKLFKRFSRISNPLSAQRGGTGLGLYLAQEIVQLHRGALEVESETGVGTTFTMLLPLRTSPPSHIMVSEAGGVIG